MTISLNNIGKRYNREWIFRRLSYEFKTSKKYAITGSNGSGKSTLLQVISGAIIFNEGNIDFKHSNVSVNSDRYYKYISIVAPYLELVEEMTAKEFLDFHSTFKTLELPIEKILSIVGLTSATDKQIRYFSSGMKQRLKLAQAFFSGAPVLLLDEPIANLDTEGIELYHYLITHYSKDKIVIISSNDKQEYHFCDEVIAVSTYKS